ncbi:hypothetical protein MXB_173 [Myxobolus squamalis]|nr:hypothetical protein MXB_173 [Myxobolus squamalis]
MTVKDIINFEEFECIPVFCFSNDMKRLAFSPNNKQVHIYSLVGSEWKLESTLGEHTERVTGIDWAPKSNRIVTCAEDRNAYVWAEESPGEWKPSLVLLRINRTATKSDQEVKQYAFAITRWVSKHIKKPIRSTVLCIDWHPSSTVLAAGAADFCVRVFSASIKDIESKPTPTGWGSRILFGSLLAEFKTVGSGWVHALAFSPDGNKLMWVAHDCTISVAICGGAEPAVVVYRCDLLPFQSCIFLDDRTLIAAGHDNSPYKFSFDGSSIKFDSDIDSAVSSKGPTLKFFKPNNSCLNLLSNNTIASSGLDCKIVIWDKF